MKVNSPLWAGFLFFTGLTILSIHIPFFWDVTYFERQADYFYTHGYTFHPLSAEIDTGGFPLYASWMTGWWKLLGRSLPVSHLALLPFLFGVVYEYLRLARKHLRQEMIWYALLLLCLEPVFCTQSMLMAYDILLVYFFLASLNALLENRMLRLSILLVLLGLSSMRGIWAVMAIGFTQIVLFRQEGRKPVKKYTAYVPFALITGAWAIFHHACCGWYFFSPLRQKPQGEEALLDMHGMIRQILFIVWKILDAGRILIWLIILICSARHHKTRMTLPAIDFPMRPIVFIPLLVFMALMVPLANPSSARYFMVVSLLSGILACVYIQEFRLPLRRLLQIAVALCLLSGNFWMYPERFSNGWDTSLKVIPYFGLKKEMTAFLLQQHISEQDVATQFPLIDNNRFTDLSDFDYQFTNAGDGPLSKFHYYLHSNTCNTDLYFQIQTMKESWKLLKIVRSGQVYLSLYENTKYGEGTKLRSSTTSLP